MQKTIANLGDLAAFEGGMVDIYFQNELRRVIADMRDRPGMPKPRLIAILITVTPTVSDPGILEDVKFLAEVTSKIPAQRTPTVSMGTRGNSALGYQDFDRANQRQLALDDQTLEVENEES